MEVGTTYKAKEKSRENGLAEFGDHVGSFWANLKPCLFGACAVQYRATDADIPARPPFLLLDASADVIESLERVLRRGLKAGQVPLEPILGFAIGMDVLDTQVGVRDRAPD